MITLTAPKISKEERDRLTKQKELLQGEIHKIESHNEKISELRKKDAELQQKRRSHEPGAAALRVEDELALSATLRTIERCHLAIEQAESVAHEQKQPLFRAIDDAQEVVGKICAATKTELIKNIADAISPYYDTRGNAEWAARTFPAIHKLGYEILQHRCSTIDSVERIFDDAQDVLRKINALLTGDVIWTYSGVATP
jgi:hypothetical protein